MGDLPAETVGGGSPKAREASRICQDVGTSEKGYRQLGFWKWVMEYTGLCVLAAFVFLFVAIAWAKISEEMGKGNFFPRDLRGVWKNFPFPCIIMIIGFSFLCLLLIFNIDFR